MTCRAYLIGYEPPGVDMDALGERWIEETIAKSDFCFTVTNGHDLRIGDCITCMIEFLPDGTQVSSDGKQYRVVGFECLGKVAVLQPLKAS